MYAWTKCSVGYAIPTPDTDRLAYEVYTEKATHIVRMNRKREHSRRMVELALYLPFVGFCCVYVFAWRVLGEAFFITHVSDSLLAPSHDNLYPAFQEIGRITDLWNWLQFGAFPVVFEDERQQKFQDAPQLGAALLLGAVRLRQWRNSQTCNRDPIKSLIPLPCYDRHRDKRAELANFGTNNQYIMEKECNSSKGIYSYSFEFAYREGQYGCRSAIWDVPAATTAAKADEQIKQLRNTDWMDPHTRAFLLEFYTYSPTYSSFSHHQFAVEFTAGGVVVPQHYSLFFRASVLRGTEDYFLLAIMCCGVLYTLYMAYRFFKAYLVNWRFKGNASLIRWFMGWNGVELASYVLIVVAIILKVLWAANFERILLLDGKTLPYQRFPPLGTIRDLWQYETYVASIFSALVILRTFKFLNTNPRLNFLTRTLTRALPTLFGMVLIFMVTIFAFAVMGHVAMAPYLLQFKSIWSSLSVLMRVLVGDVAVYDKIHVVNPNFANFLFLTYTFLVFFVVLNMVLAVIVDAFQHEVADDKGAAPLLRQLAKRLQKTWIAKKASGGSKKSLTHRKQLRDLTPKQILEKLRYYRDEFALMEYLTLDDIQRVLDLSEPDALHLIILLDRDNSGVLELNELEALETMADHLEGWMFELEGQDQDQVEKIIGPGRQRGRSVRVGGNTLTSGTTGWLAALDKKNGLSASYGALFRSQSMSVRSTKMKGDREYWEATARQSNPGDSSPSEPPSENSSAYEYDVDISKVDFNEYPVGGSEHLLPPLPLCEFERTGLHLQPDSPLSVVSGPPAISPEPPIGLTVEQPNTGGDEGRQRQKSVRISEQTEVLSQASRSGGASNASAQPTSALRRSSFKEGQASPSSSLSNSPPGSPTTGRERSSARRQRSPSKHRSPTGDRSPTGRTRPRSDSHKRGKSPPSYLSAQQVDDLLCARVNPILSLLAGISDMLQSQQDMVRAIQVEQSDHRTMLRLANEHNQRHAGIASGNALGNITNRKRNTDSVKKKPPGPLSSTAPFDATISLTDILDDISPSQTGESADGSEERDSVKKNECVTVGTANIGQLDEINSKIDLLVARQQDGNGGEDPTGIRHQLNTFMQTQGAHNQTVENQLSAIQAKLDVLEQHSLLPNVAVDQVPPTIAHNSPAITSVQTPLRSGNQSTITTPASLSPHQLITTDYPSSTFFSPTQQAVVVRQAHMAPREASPTIQSPTNIPEEWQPTTAYTTGSIGAPVIVVDLDSQHNAPISASPRLTQQPRTPRSAKKEGKSSKRRRSRGGGVDRDWTPHQYHHDYTLARQSSHPMVDGTHSPSQNRYSPPTYHQHRTRSRSPSETPPPVTPDSQIPTHVPPHPVFGHSLPDVYIQQPPTTTIAAPIPIPRNSSSVTFATPLHTPPHDLHNQPQHYPPPHATVVQQQLQQMQYAPPASQLKRSYYQPPTASNMQSTQRVAPPPIASHTTQLSQPQSSTNLNISASQLAAYRSASPSTSATTTPVYALPQQLGIGDPPAASSSSSNDSGASWTPHSTPGKKPEHPLLSPTLTR